jgi:glutaredoxin-like protein
MALIAPADQDVLRESFREMTRPVRVLFFTQTLDCPTCLQARQILDELPVLSDKITIEEVNFILDKERAREYGIEAAPAMAITYQEDGGLRDSRIRFLGTPSGYEFVSLVQAVLLAGGRESRLSPESRTQLAALERPLTMRVFTTPTCPHCPRAVTLAHEMAFASPHVTSYAIEATEFPDLARHYQVTGVPKTVVNDIVSILGALPEPDFVAQALADISSAPE